MRRAPSIVPDSDDRDIYLVLNDYDRLGRAWCETDEETIITYMMEGQYRNPVRVVAFNIAQGWCRDATADIADELRRRYVDFGEMPDSVLDFMDANRR